MLDWGLGHASRIIPVIRALQKQNVEVILASSGRAGYLLRAECPELPYVACPAYAVQYTAKNMYWNMFRQGPKMLLAMVKEHFWLRRLVAEQKIDAVISESRFGCFHTAVPSVVVTHQLRLLLSPIWLSKLVNWMYQKMLHRFDMIWVPDIPNGLSGFLSYSSPFSSTHYIGLLSRMIVIKQEIDYDLLVLLSGPEPQRTILENQVVSQLKEIKDISVLIVQGKTDSKFESEVNAVKIVSYLSGEDLQAAIAKASVVLCRSGYSSLMDLACMGKQAILVPTPGQPEQEYLAKRCQEQDWAYVVDQSNFDLKEALQEINAMEGKLDLSDAITPENITKAVSLLLKHC